MSVEIREATPEEWDDAGRVTADAYREFARGPSWEDYLGAIADVRSRVDRTTILVAVEGGRIVGSATVELTGRVEPDEAPALRDGEAHIRMFGVSPEARGRGIGRLLMAGCEERAREAGKTFMTLHTTPSMTAAQALYTALGYERGPDRVFDDGFVLLSFSRSLTTGPEHSRE